MNKIQKIISFFAAFLSGLVLFNTTVKADLAPAPGEDLLSIIFENSSYIAAILIFIAFIILLLVILIASFVIQSIRNKKITQKVKKNVTNK